MIEFFLPMKKIPTVTHQMKRVTCKNGKPIHYDSDELKDAKQMLQSRLAQHAPEDPFVGPIRLVVKWLFIGRRDGAYKITRPDLDNAQKLLQDCMTELGYWKDDAQIASLIAEKFFSTRPGIYIKIERL